MKLKIIKADAPLQGLTLNLKKTSELTYICLNTGYTFIDSLGEIVEIGNSGAIEFYNLNIFTQDIDNKLVGIQEAELIDDCESEIHLLHS